MNQVFINLVKDVTSHSIEWIQNNLDTVVSSCNIEEALYVLDMVANDDKIDHNHIHLYCHKIS